MASTVEPNVIRQSLSSAVGTLDYVEALLSRAEHGPSRDTVASARSKLKAASADLLALRARLSEGARP